MGTGAGARTKTQALLFRASWRPSKKQYEDRPASPPPAGQKRQKGLPDDSAASKSATAAYRPRGTDAGGAVAAMMRGEIDAPKSGGGSMSKGGEGGWTTNEPAPLADWELRRIEKERK